MQTRRQFFGTAGLGLPWALSRAASPAAASAAQPIAQTISDLNTAPRTRVAFVLHVGDFVEGLCRNEKLAVQQDREVFEFVRAANRGVPLLFTTRQSRHLRPGS